MLDYALRHNHLAYTKALNRVAPQLPQIVAAERETRARDALSGIERREARARQRQRKLERKKRLAKELAALLKPLPVGIGAKAARSIAENIIGQIESHIELHDEQASVGIPTVQRFRPDQARYVEALNALAAARTVDEENAARDRLNIERKAGELRPLLLATNRVTDGFLLLRHPETRRYFAFLNLIPKNSRFAALTEAEKRDGSSRRVGGLVDIRTGEVMDFQSRTGCLFPLAFGRDYQLDEFVAKARSLSAKLLKTGERYELHVSFEFVAPRVVPEARLGVDRGIYNLASLAVVDPDGRSIARENVDGRGLRFVQRRLERRQRDRQKKGLRFTGGAKLFAADEAVHVAANRIVDLARAHRSQVVMENLRQMTSRGRKRGRSNFNRVLNRSQYQKLQQVLKYKLAVAGLPPVVTVSAAFTSMSCPACGHVDKANRVKRPEGDGFKVDVFRCVRCGFADDADLNAARVIALKRMWREELPAGFREKPAAELPPDKRFERFLEIRAERRGEGACGRKAGSFGRPGLDGHEDGEVPPGASVSNDGAPLSLTPDRTPRQGQDSPTTPSAVSSSNEILPPPAATTRGAPDG